MSTVHDTSIRIPVIGDMVEITSYEFLDPNRAVELSRKRLHRVIDVVPIPMNGSTRKDINEDSTGVYHWEYEVYIEDEPMACFPYWTYKIV